MSLPSVGINVSAKGFHVVAANSEGTVTESYFLARDLETDPVAQLAEAARGLEKRFGSIDKLGIAVPGLINKLNGNVAFSAVIPEFSRSDPAEAVRAATGISPIIENDANAAAFGEFRAGAGRGAAHLFYLTLGAGVGGAFIFNESIWHGASGFAGEFGYVAIDGDGNRLEDVASSQSIVRRTLSRIHQDSTSALSKLDESDITVARIVDAAKNDDDFAILMLDRTGVLVGSAVASVINLLNLERIVVGGEVAEAGERILEPIRRRAGELSFGPSFADVEIVVGELGESAPAIGAALIAAES